MILNQYKEKGSKMSSKITIALKISAMNKIPFNEEKQSFKTSLLI